MPAVLVAVPTVMQNLPYPSSTSFINAGHLLDSIVQGKKTGADNNPHGHQPIQTISALTSITPHFTPNALSVTTRPIHSRSGQAPNNGGFVS